MKTNTAEIDRLATLLAKDPQSKAFLPLAEEYGKAGMWQEAAAVLEDGLKIYPGFVTAMVALGQVYEKLGQAAKAKPLLEDAVTRSPENFRAHRMLARIYAGEGATEEARRACSAILSLNPQDQEASILQSSLDAAPTTAQPAQAEAPASSLESLPEPESPTGPPADSPTIAKLEAWLRMIQSRRRDGSVPKASLPSSR